MKYKVLLFDSDDTLLDFKAAEKSALKKAMLESGLPFSDSLHTLYSNANQKFWKAYEKGEIEKSEIYAGRFELFLSEAGISYNAALLSNLYESRLKYEHQVIDGAYDLCGELKPYYKMYIVTNGNVKVQLPRLKDSGIANFFNDIFISEGVGSQKPQREFFDFVFKSIGVTDKSEVLIIGDSISSDISGGINAGIDTCLFAPSGSVTDVGQTYTVRTYSELKLLLLKGFDL